MTNYYIETEIKNLSERIEALTECENNGRNYIDERHKKWEGKWSFSTLLTETIFQSENLEYFSSKDLNSFHKEYEKEHNIIIDLKEIKKKQWIRIIDFQIRLPNAITNNFYCFRDYGKDKEKPDFIIKHIETFKFLFALHKKIGYRDEKRLVIKKTQLLKILENHKIIFNSCPDYKFFKKINLLKELNINKVELNIFSCNISTEITKKIASNLWLRLTANKKPKDVFNIWQYKVMKITYHLPYIYDLLPNRAFKKLIKVSIKKIVSETDLDNSEKEIDKLFWDDYMLKSFHNRILTVPKKYKIDTSNPLNLYNSLQKIESSYHIIHYQEIRSDFSFLINLVVTNDRFLSSPENSYLYTKSLLNSSLNKPFVFWKTIKLIKENRPEILPFLLIDKQFSTITQILLSELKIKSEIFQNQDRGDFVIDREKIISEFWINGFNILVRNKNFTFSKEIISNNIDFIFKYLLNEIYRSPNNNNYNQDDIVKTILHERYSLSLNILTQIKQQQSNYFLPNFIDELINIVNKPNNTLQSNEFTYFELPKYDLLLKLIAYLKTNKLDNNQQDKITEITLTSLKNKFSENLITIQADYEEFPKQVNSKWISEPYGLEKIKWETFIVECFQINKLGDFLTTLQDIKITEDYEWNSSQSHKLRTFLKILIISFQNLHDKKDIYKRQNIDINDILNELEKTITKLLVKHCQKDTTKNSIDIFSNLLETNSFGQNKPIFPIVANTINHFSNKKNIEKIISSITKSERFIYFYFLLYNSLISERDRIFLQNKIEKFDIKYYLEKAHWLPDIETTLIEAINSEVFTKHTETILNYYEKIVEKKGFNKSQDTLFYIKLLLAYRNNEESSINSIDIPDKSYSVTNNNQKYINYKSYYHALFRNKEEDFDKSLLILENISAKEPNNFEFNLRKLYTKSMIAINQSNIDYEQATIIFQEISDELNQLDKKYKEIKKTEPNKHFNFEFYSLIKLICFFYLKQHSNFEYTYLNTLNSVQRLQREFIQLAVDSFTKDNNFTKASNIINQAEKFHRLRNDEVPEFVTALKNKLNDNSNISILLSNSESVLALRPENLIRTIPEKINPFTKNIGEFLLWEISFASNQFLTKIKSIKKHIGEDEFTDLLQIIINGQLKSFNLKLDEQKRAGSSATQKKVGLGSVDLTFSNEIKDITFEAVRFNSKQGVKNNFDNIIDHIEKTFDYSTSKKYFFNIVYYQADKFILHWNEFKNNKISLVNFPKEYSLKNKIDITDKFGNDAIKVIKTIHENELEFYHIFLNLNYVT